MGAGFSPYPASSTVRGNLRQVWQHNITPRCKVLELGRQVQVFHHILQAAGRMNKVVSAR
jgi:hypothetical protein